MLRPPNEGSRACYDPFLTSQLKSNPFGGRFFSTRKSLSAIIVANFVFPRLPLRVSEDV